GLSGLLFEPATGDRQPMGAELGVGGVAVADVAAPASLGSSNRGAAVDAAPGLDRAGERAFAPACGQRPCVLFGPATVLLEDLVLVGGVVAPEIGGGPRLLLATQAQRNVV